MILPFLYKLQDLTDSAIPFHSDFVIVFFYFWLLDCLFLPLINDFGFRLGNFGPFSKVMFDDRVTAKKENAVVTKSNVWCVPYNSGLPWDLAFHGMWRGFA